MNQSATKSVLYQNGVSKILCTISISQKINNDPCFIVNSPGNVIDSSIFKPNCLSTTHKIDVENINEGTFADYINAIALCMIISGIPTDIIVSSSYEDSELIYCPMNDSIVSLKFKGNFNIENIEILKQQCIDKYNELICLSSMYC